MADTKKRYSKPKVKMEWPDEDIYKLIELVEENRALWDRNSAEYKQPKEFIWLEIVETFEHRYSLTECKAKWANLRVIFNTSLTRYRKDKNSGQDDAEKKKVWRFFIPMLFLDLTEKSNQVQTTTISEKSNVVETTTTSMDSFSPNQVNFKTENEWSEDDINNLIKLIEERPAIWDKTREYEESKEELWQQVQDYFEEKFTLTEIKDKWADLRVTFKTISAKSDYDSKEESGIFWKYFEALMFLAPNEKQQQQTVSKDLLGLIPSNELIFSKRTSKKSLEGISSKEWSDNDKQKLIEYVEERATIDDKDSPDYKKPKESLWQEIVELFDEKYSPAECQAKWTDLKSMFSHSNTNKCLKKRVRPKVKSDWSVDDILQLIKFVEQRPAIWDQDHSLHKQPKDYLWQEIGDLLENKYPLGECKAKWTNLRVSFKANLAKYRRIQLGHDDNEKSKVCWRFFNEMLFLDAPKVNQGTHSTSSVDLNASDNENQSLDEAEDEFSEIFSGESNFMPIDDMPLVTNILESRPTSPASKKIANEMVQQRVDRSVTKCLDPLDTMQRKDNYNIFGEYVASELRLLEDTPDLQHKLKRFIQQKIIDITTEKAERLFSNSYDKFQQH